MLGKIVIYNDTPAIVVKDNGDKVNLQAFNDGHSITYFNNVPVEELSAKAEEASEENNEYKEDEE